MDKGKPVKPKEMPDKRRKTAGKFSRDDIDWDLAESFFIQGEIFLERNKQGDLIRKKPSYADIGRRFKCASSLVHYHAKRRNWVEKRETWERMAAQHVYEEVSKARAYSFGEAAGILDSWLMKFEQALRENKVRFDSVSDFNTAIKLKAFIESQGSEAADTSGQAVTLQELQAKHRELRDASRELDPAVTGVIDGTPGDGD